LTSVEGSCAVGLAILICLVLASAAALVITDRARKEHKPERPDAPALDYVNTFISTLYMVLLALVVVVQWQNVNEINTDVRTEAYTLSTLMETSARMPSAEAAIVRASAVDYAQGVLRAEWPPPTSTGANTVTKALDTGQAAVTHPVDPGAQLGTIEDQAIGEFQSLQQARADRLGVGNENIPAVLIIALGVLSLITVLTPLALGLRSDALAFSGLVISTVLVCLSFWFVLDLQTLYSGLIHVDSTPLSRFLAAQAM
jgi:hydrogenase-4 membrane subunit HyfE